MVLGRFARSVVGLTTGPGFAAWLLLAIALTAGARQARTEDAVDTYTIGGKAIEFVAFADRSLLISRGCRQDDGALSCKAYSAFERGASFKVAADDPPGQAAQICEMTGGRRVRGFDPHTNERVFCKFSDGSYVDLGSLFAAARKE